MPTARGVADDSGARPFEHVRGRGGVCGGGGKVLPVRGLPLQGASGREEERKGVLGILTYCSDVRYSFTRVFATTEVFGHRFL